MTEFIWKRVPGNGDDGDFISCPPVGAKFVTFKGDDGNWAGLKIYLTPD